MIEKSLLFKLLHELSEGIIEEWLVLIVGIEDDLRNILVKVDEILVANDEGAGMRIFQHFSHNREIVFIIGSIIVMDFFFSFLQEVYKLALDI